MKLTAEQIEEAIDADGAWSLLLTLEIILGEKAEHIRSNWTAKMYDQYSKKCGKLARELEKLNI